MCMKKLIVAAACGVLFSAGHAAGADDKAACLDAVSQGQTLRDAHRLVEARAQFRICGGPQCPHVLQTDCATWLAELERILPTVVFSAKDGAGHDVLDASVSVDGKVVASKLDGEAVPVDPGLRTFRFERPDGTTTTQQILIKEGEKARGVALVLEPAAAPPPRQPGAPPSATGSPGAEHEPLPSPAALRPASPMRLIGWIVGGAGIAGLGVATGIALDAKSKDNTAAGEPGLARQTDSQAAVQQGNVATVVFGIGAAALATGVVLWILAPSPSTTVGINGRDVVLRGSF
jgi:hypothetical protein